MTTDRYYDMLHGIFSDSRFHRVVGSYYRDITLGGMDADAALQDLGDDLRTMYGLNAEQHERSLQLTFPTQRGKAPACIMVSPNSGQPLSGSAMSTFKSLHYQMALFERGADDTGVENYGAIPAYRAEAQSRVLFH